MSRATNSEVVLTTSASEGRRPTPRWLRRARRAWLRPCRWDLRSARRALRDGPRPWRCRRPNRRSPRRVRRPVHGARGRRRRTEPTVADSFRAGTTTATVVAAFNWMTRSRLNSSRLSVHGTSGLLTGKRLGVRRRGSHLTRRERSARIEGSSRATEGRPR